MVIDDHFKGKEEWQDRRVQKLCANGEFLQTEDTLLHEHVLEIEVNGRLFARLVCTPKDLPGLVLGRLCTSRVITGLADVERLFLCAKGDRAEVTLRPGIELKEWKETEASCCSANHCYLQNAQQQEEKILPAVTPDPQAVFALAEQFKKDSSLHRRTNGTHSAYLRAGDGSICGFEDISRHNALDKAVGHMLLKGYEAAECVLYTSGRVPVDMVEKAIASGVPLLVSKSVPTAEAVELARQYGLCLLGKAWPDSYLCYAP